MEIPAVNGKFTWFRGQSKSKLDRVVLQPEWIGVFPSIKVSLLKRSISDHCPLLVCSKEKNWGPKPFRFLNCWISHPNYSKIISETWQHSSHMNIKEKLKKVKERLKEWNRKEFGFIESQIDALELKINKIDSLANDRLLEEDELNERKMAQLDLWEWLKRKESYWAQNSRSQWLREGDKNTRFFHAAATIRRRKKLIDSLTIEGALTEDPEAIKREAASFFKKIFTEDFHSRPRFDNLNFNTISSDQANFLISPFSHMEIEEAVKECDSNKAPGPDGFNFKFIKEAWDTIKYDIFGFVEEFWSSGKLPRGYNNAFIALIPKIDLPTGFKDYRPISMVGCLYKIVSKLLARRLQSVMDSLIGPSQSAFIKGRQILDGALIADEVIESCKKRNIKASILKLDFHKAFDSVSWSFLEEILVQMGFPAKWRSWIHSCISTASASILINGSPSPPFKLQKGLRQGDPLSPFLFNLVMESLNLLIQKATARGLWEGIRISRRGSAITHLQYADDIIIFSPPNIEGLINIKKTLILFHLASGLKVNFHKSSILGLHTGKGWISQAASSLLCKQGALPFTYLGLPMGGSTSRIAMWEPVIDRMKMKLANWKGRLLSMGGRAVLIKSSLASLPMYYLSLFPIPKGALEKINRIQRDFFWNGCSEKKGIHSASWALLEMPKIYGGLNLGNLLHRNLALLFKWIWRFFSASPALWKTIIKEKYGYSSAFSCRDISIPSQEGPWKRICRALLQHTEAKKLVLSCIRKKAGNGNHILFWHDIWIGDTPLKIICPRLFSISTLPNGLVSSLGFWDGRTWKWSLSWLRSLRPQDSVERCNLQSLLDNVVLSPEASDSLIWCPQKSGEFSVKSFSMELAKSYHNGQIDIIKGMWRSLVPHRIEIFTRLALLGKINTKAKLASLGIIPADQAACILCDKEVEFVDHLFLHCIRARQIWHWWLEIWELKGAFPSSLRSMYDQWLPPIKGKFFKKIWAAIFFIIVWSLWKERNMRIFDRKCSSPAEIQDLVLTRLCCWIEGWGEPFPYSASEVIRNPRCLAWNEATTLSCSPRQPKVISWIPPAQNVLKWNVDASFNPLYAHSAIGGVLRDASGRFMCVFSSPIPLMEINSAKVFAIHRAIKISSASHRNTACHIIIESDSHNAVSWCNAKEGGPWNLAFILNFIRNSLKEGLGFSIVYRGRESNYVADALAKQGLRRVDNFIAWI